MPDLKLDELRDKGEQPDGRQVGQRRLARLSAVIPGPDTATQRAVATMVIQARRVAAIMAPRSLWRNHRLFTVLVLLSILPRVLAAAAFRPALLTADSFLYMQETVLGFLGTIRPSGYSYFLGLFQGSPDALLLVTIVQHLMGIGVAVIVYVLLRYWGLPGWGAALAAVPTLFDTREIALESYILPDTLFFLVIMLAVALLLTKRTPRMWQCVTAALLFGYASLLRGNGIPLVVAVAAFLLIRKVGWKSCTAAAVAFAVPVLWYVHAFHAQTGQYNITESDGIFLWSRTTSFANCAIIKPPHNLAPLCPDKEKSQAVPPAPPWSLPYLLAEPTPAGYLWATDAWWRHDAQPGFNAYNNRLGLDFALDAIKAQPLDYLKVSARDVLLAFLATDRPQEQQTMNFTVLPHVIKLPSYYVADEQSFAGSGSNTHPVYPYAFFLFLYQQPVYFPGILFLLVVIAGLAGVIRNWRRWGGMQALPWALAAISIISPALLTQALYRYMMVAIPLACLAAGLGFARQDTKLVAPEAPGTAGNAGTAGNSGTAEAPGAADVIGSANESPPAELPPCENAALPDA